AVFSHSEAIDPVGACVGQRGNRINTITSELSGEKIDIILWSDDPKTFLINALSPSKISDIEIKSSHEAIIYVPADQLSLTIGKNGQNVRLAAKLTGWRIEVRTIEEPSKTIDEGVSEESVTDFQDELPSEELEEQIEKQQEQIETEEQLTESEEQTETEN
ncbi:MAG TPA: transcription termination/antitermination protein NusA, partial [Candidatus Paceibacterota bacterium]|nr:transcription termination/antitermination protein NusA [Candidatus Paceibacterota bacterium]